uniref:(northern house mosquito) hypothetical protein n=1 Tax=Culex pipiens TaxID=7175 RepID=A0A8D8FQU6_CULPI
MEPGTRCAYWPVATRSTKWAIGRPICATRRSSTGTVAICAVEFWHRGRRSGTTCSCMMGLKSSVTFAIAGSQLEEVCGCTYGRSTSPVGLTLNASIATRDLSNKRICSPTCRNIESVSRAKKPFQILLAGSTTTNDSIRKVCIVASSAITLHSVVPCWIVTCACDTPKAQ